MSQLLRIASISALLYQLFGGRAAQAISDSIETEIDAPQLRDFSVAIERFKVVGYMNLRLYVKQSTGFNTNLAAVNLSFSQQGKRLGEIQNAVGFHLENNKTTRVPLRLRIPASPFLDHLTAVIERRPNANAIAPITVEGTMTFSNGLSFPIYRTISFLNVS